MSRKNEAPSSRYMGGYVSAVSEYGEHKFDLDEVIYDLQTHPSENEEQQGYLDALLSIRRYEIDGQASWGDTPEDGSYVTYDMHSIDTIKEDIKSVIAKALGAAK